MTGRTTGLHCSSLLAQFEVLTALAALKCCCYSCFSPPPPSTPRLPVPLFPPSQLPPLPLSPLPPRSPERGMRRRKGRRGVCRGWGGGGGGAQLETHVVGQPVDSVSGSGGLGDEVNGCQPSQRLQQPAASSSLPLSCCWSPLPQHHPALGLAVTMTISTPPRLTDLHRWGGERISPP